MVYPLIERGRWQRRERSRSEAAWDYLRSRVFHMPDAGVLLDRMMQRVMPPKVIQQLDDSLDLIIDHLPIEEEFELEPAAGEGSGNRKRHQSPTRKARPIRLT